MLSKCTEVLGHRRHRSGTGVTSRNFCLSSTTTTSPARPFHA
jgi:hypothetical protein